MQAPDEWLPYYTPRRTARVRLFCFPYAGGGAWLYRHWQALLPPEIEVCSVQLPGREQRLQEPSFDRLMPLVRTLAEALYGYLDMPFALFGHSMGALISFELARELRAWKAPPPSRIFVSACRAPHLPHLEPPIHGLPKAQFVDELRRLDGTPEEVLQNTELMQLLLPTLRADFALWETYRYGDEEPLACPLSAFGGLQDAKISRDNIAAWRDQTSSTFRLRMFQGDHFFLNSARIPVLRAILQDLDS